MCYVGCACHKYTLYVCAPFDRVDEAQILRVHKRCVHGQEENCCVNGCCRRPRSLCRALHFALANFFIVQDDHKIRTPAHGRNSKRESASTTLSATPIV